MFAVKVPVCCGEYIADVVRACWRCPVTNVGRVCQIFPTEQAINIMGLIASFVDLAFM